MLRSLAPVLGCGLMMVACMALMGRSGRNRHNDSTAPDSNEEIAALRDEVARLRSLDEQRQAPSAEDPAP